MTEEKQTLLIIQKVMLYIVGPILQWIGWLCIFLGFNIDSAIPCVIGAILIYEANNIYIRNRNLLEE